MHNYLNVYRMDVDLHSQEGDRDLLIPIIANEGKGSPEEKVISRSAMTTWRRRYIYDFTSL